MQQTCREKGGGRGVGEKLGACQSGSEEGQGVRGEGRAGGREGQEKGGGGGGGGALACILLMLTPRPEGLQKKGHRPGLCQSLAPW